jgi:hypothetical protein
LQVALRGAQRRVVEPPELAARIAELAAQRGEVVPRLDLLFVLDALFLHGGRVDDDRLTDVVAGQPQFDVPVESRNAFSAIGTV